MKMQGLKVDYYAGYEGEPEIRFYITPEKVDFRSDRKIGQGEDGIYFFSVWNGYFDIIAHALFERANRNSVYTKAPKFLKDWNQHIGWSWDNSIPELVPAEEITWLLRELAIMQEEKEAYSKELESELTIYDCIRDLMRFLAFAEKENMEIKVSSE